MKVVRNKVEEHFRDRLEYLYTPEGRDLKNPKNLASLKKIVDCVNLIPGKLEK